MLKQINRKFKLDVLTTEYTADLVKYDNNINNIIIQKDQDTAVILASKLKGYDLVFNFCSTAFNAKLCRLLDASYKVGYAYKLYNIFSFNRLIWVHRNKPVIHETEFCAKFLEVFGTIDDELIARGIETANIFIDELSKRRSLDFYKSLDLDKSKKTIGIHPGDNRSAFNWHPAKYIELGERLRTEYNVIFIFGPSELRFYNLFTEEQQTQFAFVAGNLKLLELAAFIKFLDCLVSASTGPMHIAGIMEVPTISIFSNKPSHSYLKWHPIKNKHIIIEPPIKYSNRNRAKIMDLISVESVYFAIKSVLTGQ